MKRFIVKQASVKQITVAGITAAAYFVVTMLIAPLAFGDVQFRISEVLNLLAFVNPVYAVGVTLGCFISNLTMSPYGLIDIFFGTLHTGLSVLMISKTKSLFLATLWPTALSLIIAAEIAFMAELPFFLTAASVMAGEFAVVTVIGYPLFAFVILKNKALLACLKSC